MELLLQKDCYLRNYTLIQTQIFYCNNSLEKHMEGFFSCNCSILLKIRYENGNYYLIFISVIIYLEL